jgi:hypothetical protein
LQKANSAAEKKTAAITTHYCPETKNGAQLDAVNSCCTSVDGGAGIRTPVREKIDHSVYVRVPLIEVSSRWPMDSPLLDKFPKFSPAAGKRDD